MEQENKGFFKKSAWKAILFSQNGQLLQLELIQVKKILNEYYIDSVRLAG